MKTMKPNRGGLRPLFAWCLLAALLPASLWAQDLPYTSPSTGADGPLTFKKIVGGGRSSHALAYDSVNN